MAAMCSSTGQAIVTIGGARTDKGQPMLTGKATCLVTLVDGKFVTVVEGCDAVRQKLGTTRRKP